MRILQVGATFVGAQKKIEHAIYKYTLGQNHDGAILYSIGESNDPNIICYENKLDSIIRRGLRKVLGKCPRFALISTLKLIRRIKVFHPDLIHIHIIHHGYLDYEYLLRYIAKQEIPVVFTVHDMWFFTGGCYYFSEINCEGFQMGCVHCPKSTKELDCRKSATEKNLKKKIKLFGNLKKVGFVSVSPWVFSKIKKSALSLFPQYMIMNSIDNVDFVPFMKRKREKFTIVGVATSWNERKGLNRFYKLGAALKEQCDIILVGNVREDLKNEAPSNIIFYGYANSTNELYNLYASCDLHVSMSFEETFGLTFVEAALSGIRSMGFDSTAIPVVLKKTHGYIIASCTVEEVEKEIQQLIQNREMCVITEEEYLGIKKYFSPERMAFEYQKVYEEMCDFHD